MALRVPTIDAPSVAAAPLQTPYQRTSASPALLQSDQLGQAGKALQEIGAQIQERTDADAVMRAETDLKNQYAEWESQAKQRRGQQAWGVAKDATKFVDDSAAKVSEGLTTERQRFLFNQSAQRLRTLSLSTFGDFEAGERRRSLDESAQASIVGSINMAAANPQNPDILGSAKADVLKRTTMLAQLNGWSPEMRDAKQGEYLTNFHKQVIQGLVRDNPASAQSYFDANKGEIDGSQHAEIGAFAQKATATRLGDQAAEAAWQTAGPKSDRDPVTLDTLEERIRTSLKGNDEAIKSGISAVRERAAAFKDARRERDDQLEASVNKAILDGASGSQIRNMPAFMQLSPESARKIMDYVENRALRNEQRAAARESRSAAADARQQAALTREGMGAYLVYSNPDTLAGMSEAQVLNLLPSLGNELTQHLMTQKRALGNPGKLAEARMDTEDFNHVARAMQLPVDEKASPDQKAQMGELKFRVEQRIAATQQATGKPMARNEKMDLMRQEMARTVSVSGFFSNSEVPVIALTPKQVADVVIPTADRKQLSDAMATMYRRTGGAPEYEPTDANLRRFYLLRKSPAADMILPKR